MNVLLVAPQPYYSDRGTPIAVFLRCHAYDRLDHEVDLFTYPMGEDRVPEGICLFRLPPIPGINHVPIGPSVRKLFFDSLLFVYLLWHLLFRKNDYEFIDAFEEASILARPLSYLSGIPLVYDYQSSMAQIIKESHLYGFDFVSETMGSLERSTLRASDAVICMGETFVDDFSRVIPEKKIFPIEFTAPEQLDPPPQPSNEEFRPIEEWIDPSKITLGYVGSLRGYQNLEKILKALSQSSKRRRIQFIVGGGTDSQVKNLKNHVKDLDLTSSVKILGWVSDPVRIELFRQVDVLVSGRVGAKGIPIKVYTYMWIGKPLLLADGESHRALFGDEDVIWADPTVEGFREALEKLPNVDREALSERTRSLFENKYDFECFVDKHHPLVDYATFPEGSN